MMTAPWVCGPAEEVERSKRKNNERTEKVKGATVMARCSLRQQILTLSWSSGRQGQGQEGQGGGVGRASRDWPTIQGCQDFGMCFSSHM